MKKSRKNKTRKIMVTVSRNTSHEQLLSGMKKENGLHENKLLYKSSINIVIVIEDSLQAIPNVLSSFISVN